VAVEDPVHLEHASSLAKENIRPDSVPSPPFMDYNQAKGLNVGQVRVIKVLVDETNGLGGKQLGSGCWATISADQGDRAPVINGSVH
jgi:hypothetical protein